VEKISKTTVHDPFVNSLATMINCLP